ncbi:hypothetical protein MC885_011631 [Smutsia gigantea]|nr:hypothetical protein MC885_011631 [Smutsia gigantea]
MAAEIQPKPLTRKPILLQRVEGSQEVVNMAVIVPKEEGVISVSEDSYLFELKGKRLELGRTHLLLQISQWKTLWTNTWGRQSAVNRINKWLKWNARM